MLRDKGSCQGACQVVALELQPCQGHFSCKVPACRLKFSGVSPYTPQTYVDADRAALRALMQKGG
jgi:hypothetical protein